MVRVTGTLERFRKFGLSDGEIARLVEEPDA